MIVPWFIDEFMICAGTCEDTRGLGTIILLFGDADEGVGKGGSGGDSGLRGVSGLSLCAGHCWSTKSS